MKKNDQQIDLFMQLPMESPAQTAVEIPSPRKIASRPRLSMLDQTYNSLVTGLRKFFTERGFKRGALGLSGGVDSALTLKIAIDALGPENVTALIMPELGLTKQENIDHAKLLCQFLKVPYFYQPINNFLVDFSVTPWQPSDRAKINTKARVRAVLLYSYANTENALILGTSNKSEILLGYGTKYGDLCADVEVIGDLYKTEVWQLADHIGLPPEIVNKTPSAELAADQTDEGEMGATYKDMDQVLMKLSEGFGPDECIEHGLSMPLVQMVFRRAGENKHKSEMPFVIKVQ